MALNKDRLQKMKALARRDDCFTAHDGFVPSDIRELIAEVETAYAVMGEMADIAAEFGKKLSNIGSAVIPK